VNTLNDLSFQKSEIELISYALLQNFSNASFTMNWNPAEGNDIHEPRTPGLYFRQPQAIRIGAQFNTDTRKRSQLQISGAAKWFEFPAAHFSYSGGASPLVRIGDHIILSFTSLYSRHRNNQAFATRLDAITPVFGLRQERSVESIAVFQYLFSPYSNLSLRARDYWSKVKYDQYYLLNEDGGLEAIEFTGSADVNFHLLNIDMIYTWQYAPGSFLSLSWKTNAVQNAPDNDSYIQSVRKIFDYPKSTSISVRINYYFDYARVRNRNKHQ
jgi:hypothetical protein